MGILLSKFRFNFNAIQTLISRLHGELCHIRFGDLWQERSEIMAAVTSELLTIVKTGITIVSYFGNVTASLFALTIVRKFTPR